MIKLIIPFIISIVILSSCGRKTSVTTPVIEDVTELVFGSGTIEAHDLYYLTAQTDGYILSMNIETGTIAKVQAIAALISNVENDYNAQSATSLFDIKSNNRYEDYNPTLRDARQKVISAKDKLEYDSIQWVRYQNLYEKEAVALQELEAMKLTFVTSKANYVSAVQSYDILKQQTEEQFITSSSNKNISLNLQGKNQILIPSEGLVYEVYKKTGDYVKKGDIIAKIGNPNSIYAKVYIDEKSIYRVKTGQQISLSLNTVDKKVYAGVVKKIHPQFDVNSQSYICEIEFLTVLDFSSLGTQLQCNIVVGETKGALLIPRDYYGLDGTVTLAETKEKVEVNAAFVSTEWVQIKEGITSNTALLTVVE
jgi:HlyD family secretion protein